MILMKVIDFLTGYLIESEKYVIKTDTINFPSDYFELKVRIIYYVKF